MQQRYLFASILICGVSFPAFAQDAGSLLRDKERADEAPKLPTLPKADADTPPTPPSVDAETAQTVRIKTVRFDGSASLLTEAQRTQVASSIEGALEDIVFNYDDSVRTNPETFTATTNRYVDRQSLKKNDLETALLRMNDLPGVTTRSRLAPDEAAGTTKLIVDVSQTPVFSGSLVIADASFSTIVCINSK